MLPRSLRILVVAGDIAVRRRVHRALRSADTEVDIALSGEEALKKDAAAAYDVIIADLQVSGAGDLDLLRSIKAQRPGAAVIVIAGSRTIKTAVEAMKLGASDYLPKSVKAADLRTAAARALLPAEENAADKETAAPCRVPPGYQCLLGHTWLEVDGAGQGTVGIVQDFLKAVGDIARIDLPKVGDEVSQGALCGKIVDSGGVLHLIWSPASGTVTEVNAALASDPSLIRHDPYGRGFLFRIQATSLDKDLKGLLRAR